MNNIQNQNNIDLNLISPNFNNNIEQKNGDIDKKIKKIFGKQLLKSLKVDLKKRNYLYIACENGLLEIVKKLLNHKDIDPNKGDGYHSPLYIACEKGHLKIVKELLKRKDINLGEYYLYIACKKGHLNIVKEFLNHKDINPNNKKYRLALYVACEKGHLNIVKEFLNHKNINPNKGDKYSSPLSIACEKGHLDIVKELLKHPKIDPNKEDKYSSPLSIACKEGHLDIVKELLKHPKIDLNKDSALLIACEYGYLNIVKELLKRKDINLGEYCLYIACEKGHLDIVKALLNHPKIDQNKGYVNNPFNPLYVACEYGYLDIVKELLKHPKIDPKHKLIKKLLYRLVRYCLEKKDKKDKSFLQFNDTLFQMIIKTKKKIKSPLNSLCFKYAFSYVNKDYTNLAYRVCKKLYMEGTKIPKEIKKSEKFKEIFSIQTKMFSEKSFQDLKIKHI